MLECQRVEEGGIVAVREEDITRDAKLDHLLIPSILFDFAPPM